MSEPAPTSRDRINTTTKTLITISIPVFNEEQSVGKLLERLDAATAGTAEYAFEYLFTDNASTDRTFEILAEAAKVNSRIRVLRLSRNFGFQKSILTNYLNARGEAAIQIDADLQDPPELIPEFLRLWRQGYKVVYGIRRHRQENSILRLSRKLYYRLLEALSDVPVPVDAGDFRLIDRTIIDHLRQSRDDAPYLRGMIASFGYPQTGIVYDRSPRLAGNSKFRLGDMIRLGIDGITSQSVKPLEFIVVFGFMLSLLSGLGIVAYMGAFIFGGVEVRGFTTLVLLILVSIGLNSMLLGVLGEYIGRTYRNVRNLPMTIIQQRIEPVDRTAEEETIDRKVGGA